MRLPQILAWGVGLACASLLSACGGGEGPALDAVPQSITFAAPPTLQPGGSASVSASASSGLAVRYDSLSPMVCSVDPVSGQVTALATGDCILSASQDGDRHFAPAPPVRLTLRLQASRQQTLSLVALPTLTLYGAATVSVSASSGLSVSYASSTPQQCSVDPISGLVSSLSAGDCLLVASQPGDASHDAATPLNLTLTVAPGSAAVSAPTTPLGVSATLGPTDDTVIVGYTGLGDAGGSPITTWTARSIPAGLTASSSGGPVTVSCRVRCTGYAFTLTATNASGDGPASAAAEVLTAFEVRARFREPDTQPNDTIFVGTFVLNSTTRTVSGLSGSLSESMTGSADGLTPMTQIRLSHQLATVDDGAGGLLVSTFALNTPDTFGPNGFADTVNGIYYGYPAAWNAASANSFVTLDLDPDLPTRALNATEVLRLSYGDCALGGMMGAACMTGWASGGTMGGYPVEQVVTRQPAR